MRRRRKFDTQEEREESRRTYDKIWKRRQRNSLRLEFIKEYGGKCANCGEMEIMFLTLEHLDGDGKNHRKEFGGYNHLLLMDLKKNGWPKDKYSLLCFSCNREKYVKKMQSLQ